MVGREVSEFQHDAQGFSGWVAAPLPRRFGALLVDWILCLLASHCSLLN